MAREYLDDYRKFGMARRIGGRWWLAAVARKALTAAAPNPPAIGDPMWLDDSNEPYDRRPGGWVRWHEWSGWTRERQ
jgi:hypothetical protein